MPSTHANYLRPREAAALLRVSTKTIYGWIDQGRLDAERIAGRTLRIKREKLDAIREPAIE